MIGFCLALWKLIELSEQQKQFADRLFAKTVMEKLKLIQHWLREIKKAGDRGDWAQGMVYCENVQVLLEDLDWEFTPQEIEDLRTMQSRIANTMTFVSEQKSSGKGFDPTRKGYLNKSGEIISGIRSRINDINRREF